MKRGIIPCIWMRAMETHANKLFRHRAFLDCYTQTVARSLTQMLAKWIKANGQEINNNKKRGGVFLDSACGCCKRINKSQTKNFLCYKIQLHFKSYWQQTPKIIKAIDRLYCNRTRSSCLRTCIHTRIHSTPHEGEEKLKSERQQDITTTTTTTTTKKRQVLS